MFKPIKEILKKNKQKNNEEYLMFLAIEKQFKKTQEKKTTTNLQIHDYKEGTLIIKAKIEFGKYGFSWYSYTNSRS